MKHWPRSSATGADRAPRRGDLLLYSGAFDHRNGEIDAALAKHRKAQTMRDEID
ncbi:MAG: hypothetical protein ABIR16_08150 [Dokdonella sp.]